MLEIGVLSGTLQGCHPTLKKNVGQCKSIHGLCAMPKLGLAIAPHIQGYEERALLHQQCGV